VEKQVSKRKYDSTRRQAQAAITRRSILEAAQRRFEADGYVATTMEAIAAEAGVALKTVYAAFTTKSGVLRATWDLLLKGDVDDAPVAARPWYVQAVEEKNPRRQVELIVRSSCAVKRRIGAILGVIRGAASVDPDAATLWDLIQSDFHANQGALVASIHANGGLRAGLDVGTATDVLWTLNHPDTWLLLVGERGWSPERFEAWFAEAARVQLLGGRTGEVAW
jgi:AcrR family transcriptional regulator